MRVLSDIEEKELLRLEIADLEKRIDHLGNRPNPNDPFGLRDVILGGDMPSLKSELIITLGMELAEKKNRLNELNKK